MRAFPGIAVIFFASMNTSMAAAAGDIVLTEFSEQANFDLVTVADNLRRPSSVAFTRAGDTYITGWHGELWRIRAGTSAVEAIPIDLSLADGSGLRTVTPHPSFEENGLLYFCFANGSEERNETHFARGRVAGDEVIELTTIFKAGNFSEEKLHQSCTVVWDTPQTFLLALGDRYYFPENAQSLSDYYGVIVRLDENGVPAETRLASSNGARPGIWSYGHRNPQGLVIDPASGEVWSHEHGPKGGDEVNHLVEGLNYGWPAATFGIDYDDSIISETPLLEGTEPPVYYWYPSIAPSGLAVYSGDEFAKWRGDLFVGGLRSQRLHRLERLNGHVISEEELLAELNVRIRDVRSGPDGSLYVLTDEEAGRLLKLVPTTASPDDE